MMFRFVVLSISSKQSVKAEYGTLLGDDDISQESRGGQAEVLTGLPSSILTFLREMHSMSLPVLRLCKTAPSKISRSRN